MIREKTGDPAAKMRGIICFAEGGVQFKPTIAIYYRKKKKDGSFNKTETEIELAYEYCPFCGQKYNEETKEKQ